MPYNSTLCLQHSFIHACYSQLPSSCQGCNCQTFLLPLSTLFVEFLSICYVNTWSFYWNQQSTATLSPLLSCWTQNSLICKVIYSQKLFFNKQWPSTTSDLRCLLIGCRGLGFTCTQCLRRVKGPSLLIGHFKYPFTYLLCPQCALESKNPRLIPSTCQALEWEK